MVQPRVYIVIYTLYHHIYKLSLRVRDGLEAKGVRVEIFQVRETLEDSVLEKMHTPAKPDIPIIEPAQLAEADGIIFGIPTRFGIFPAQMKTLLDATGQLWAKGSLSGKFVATFFSTASQHGGQETTALNAVTYFAHHGMIYVPFGYANAGMSNVDDVIGGSAYGAGTVTNGDGSRQPSQVELDIARDQGENFAVLLNTYFRGKNIVNNTGADTDASTRSIRGETPLNQTTATGGESEVLQPLNPEPVDAPLTTAEGPAAETVAQEHPATAISPNIDTQPAGATTEAPVQPSETTDQQNATTTAATTAAVTDKPKRRRRFWFCCGNPQQLE
ncbi:hypothetical protein EC973_007199 [Apophysomyces ossiformis]|uniref:Flavodoxin-like domain-containing protein n=1 Tax=Apophysomyces ossiformis TaxID=679940 RepID=A0A8H7EQL2_9FUNG|nr:hypothetical protein EC973_007199 [Apophysomyces ossiformis]